MRIHSKGGGDAGRHLAIGRLMRGATRWTWNFGPMHVDTPLGAERYRGRLRHGRSLALNNLDEFDYEAYRPMQGRQRPSPR